MAPPPASERSRYAAALYANHHLLGEVPDTELAAEIGCCALVIHSWRKRAGIAPYPYLRYHPSGRSRVADGRPRRPLWRRGRR